MELCETVYNKTASILSTQLLVPKYGELRTRNLKVLGTVIKLLVESKRPSLVYHLYNKKDSKTMSM